MRPFSKQFDKQQQTQNIKDPSLETLQDTIFTLKAELVKKQKPIDTLMLIIKRSELVRQMYKLR